VTSTLFFLTKERNWANKTRPPVPQTDLYNRLRY